ncbi:MAG TPA: YceI family protein [Flavobacteriaceae bacterium]|nr:YceI family protein [Flavobacteriaceae bacterium]
MDNKEKRTKWKIDPVHSEIIFKVKHLMISNLKGEFRKFDAEILSDGNDFSNAKITASIDASSVFTNNTDRDTHLKSAEFFDADQFEKLRFESTEVEKVGNESFKLKGNLSMKGKTREITLDVEFGGIMKDPQGKEKAGFSLRGKINRKEWGLNWNANLEAGGVLVSEEVRILIDAQFIKTT